MTTRVCNFEVMLRKKDMSTQAGKVAAMMGFRQALVPQWKRGACMWRNCLLQQRSE